MREKSRDTLTASVTSSRIRREDADIRRLDISIIIEYITAAIEIILG